MSADRARTTLDRVLHDARTNAVLAWTLVGFVLLVAAANLAAGAYLWAGFAASVAALAVVPPALLRTPRAMLPWEVLALTTLPLLGRTFATVRLTSDLATYLSVAAIALVIAVLLHVFTPVKMTSGFAVFFVVVTTMAAAGVWAVVRYALDVTLGTAFLLDPALSEEVIERQLMFEFVYSTVAGVGGGVVFEWYFRRIRRREDCLPEGIDLLEGSDRRVGP